MSASLPGNRDLPVSQYDLSTYIGRVKHAIDLTDPRYFSSSSFFHVYYTLGGLQHPLCRDKRPRARQAAPDGLQDGQDGRHDARVVEGQEDCRLNLASRYIFPPCSLLTHPSLSVIPSKPRVLEEWAAIKANVLRMRICPTCTKNMKRYRRACLSALPHVLLRAHQPRRHGGHAPAGPGHGRHRGVAGGEPVAQRGHQQRQRQQVVAHEHGDAGQVVRRGRDGLVLGGARPQRARAAAARPDALDAQRAAAAGALCGVRPVLSAREKQALQADGRSERDVPSLGRSRKAARLAVYETAASRVFNSSPIMVIPPMLLYYAQTRQGWYRNLLQREFVRARPALAAGIPVGLNLLYIAATSFAVLPLALAVFPQQQEIAADKLEPEFHGKGGSGGKVWFNRGL
ncbi:sideroflexin-1 [Moelleriella libera RCEF 2490]|uniref:Sideroflexin-1 n=1 Tax=Moelleriella libera RCEF 2490 TaxID=1081109 RepID=A0A168BXC8_9HYPO|nr:sideroflexin-1 [Moelleriella libera RCEF 2490]